MPAQTGHFKRIKATPSDLPFKSTGFATYPVPPQFGQSSGLNPLPLTVEGILHDWCAKSTKGFFPLRITNKNCWRAVHPVTTDGKGAGNVVEHSQRAVLISSIFLADAL